MDFEEFKNLDKAIRSIHTNVVSVGGNTKEEMIAKNDDDNEVTIDWTQVDAWVNPEQYKIDRQYPSIGEQLDMQYWDAINGTTTWKDAIAQVKADNPKPE